MSLSKFAPPPRKEIFHREKLYTHLDQISHHPVVWIVGPAGAGKTTLAAGYLQSRKHRPQWYTIDKRDVDPGFFFTELSRCPLVASEDMPRFSTEYLGNIDKFATLFFSDFFRKRNAFRFLVFDDVHEALDGETFAQALAAACRSLPPRRRLWIIGRSPPPAQFRQLRDEGIVGLVDWSHLKLDSHEATEIIHWAQQDHNHNSLDPRIRSDVYEKSDGLIAAVVLLTRTPLTLGKYYNIQPCSESGVHPLLCYLAHAIVDRLPDESQRVVIQTCLLPRFSAQSVTELTGIEGASQILEQLFLHSSFTYRHLGTKPIYQHHAIFRTFLQTQLTQRFSSEECRALSLRAADLLASEEQSDEAINLLLKYEAWGRLVKLLSAIVPAYIERGALQTVVSWLSELPVDLMETEGWLNYWLGASLAPFDPAEGRKRLRQAYTLFKTAPEIEGLYLAWSAIVESLVLSWEDFSLLDSWIQEGEWLQTPTHVPKAAFHSSRQIGLLRCRIATPSIRTLPPRRAG